MKTIESTIGNTPLVQLQNLYSGERGNKILVKLEGSNPSGSIKDRAAYFIIDEAQKRGEIAPGDSLIEATSGNTGIALAMVAAMRGYNMTLIMPESASEERKMLMRSYGAKLILVDEKLGMEGARDLALKMQDQGKGRVLNQFDNHDNSLAHYRTTGPEIWSDTKGQITHFISAMGTTGTITGTSHFLKEQCVDIKIIGLQPAEGANIPGIRRWTKEYMPKIFSDEYIDDIQDIDENQAIETMQQMAKKEGISCGVSSGGIVYAALKLAQQTQNATIVAIVCDKGERYLSVEKLYT